MTAADLSRLDVPLADVELQTACETTRKALAKTNSPSDRIAYANDLFLLTHPEACSTDADYPEWPAEIAVLIARSENTRRAR
ncbi:hypothetical protein ASD97_24580 [Streptomyces sp. Root63]|uniref:hypothetical protein n=1 Tax=unclassified Streptomyces TaxID=2593676 RepID=UPI0006FCAB3F|nr:MULTISPECIES: hypothetical protein [unclassified Streptomyces]KQX27482.1 hypothetical protein ASD29_29810 [Streptomyces sp. Root1295]KRA34722.1 hypothetical protein ASD97_24580 [Streptomyces sp. Root63]